MLVVRNDLHARIFRIRKQVARSRQIRVHTHHPFKRLRQWQSKKSHACIQIQRQIAFRTRRHRFQQVLRQEPIHLKKRQMANMIFESTYLVNQKSRPSQFETVLLLVQQQQAFKPRQFRVKQGSDLPRWRVEFIECHVKRNFLIRRIGKRPYLQNPRRQFPASGHLLQQRERLQQSRR